MHQPPPTRSPRRSDARAFKAIGLPALCLVFLAASASAGCEEPSAPQPLPIPAPAKGGGDPVQGAASPTAGWIAVIDNGSDGEREAAEILRQWAASRVPALPPFEERLPSGTVKLHHNGHFFSTLFATIDEEGSLRYSHQPPPEPGDEIAPPPSGDSPSSDSAAAKGGAR